MDLANNGLLDTKVNRDKPAEANFVAGRGRNANRIPHPGPGDTSGFVHRSLLRGYWGWMQGSKETLVASLGV